MITEDFHSLRKQMIDQQLIPRGISDVNVLNSMNNVPREKFVPFKLIPFAYQDSALPIGDEQTISQPFMVSYMAQEAFLKPEDKVLEVGTGCGYSAAVLSNLVQVVYSTEIIRSLADNTRSRLQALGYNNIIVQHSDGSVGLPSEAPFDAILVTASAPSVPHELKEQLAINGRLIIPVVDKNSEALYRFTKLDANCYEEEYLEEVRFVPLTGKGGWFSPNLTD